MQGGKRDTGGPTNRAVMLGALPATITPTPEDTRLAQKASQQLAKLLQGRKKNVRFRIQPTDKPDETVTLPLSILRLLAASSARWPKAIL